MALCMAAINDLFRPTIESIRPTIESNCRPYIEAIADAYELGVS